MKINIKTQAEKEITLPKFFKVGTNKWAFYKCVGNESVIAVKDYEFDESLALAPQIEVIPVRYLAMILNEGVNPISEVEFKTAYLSVSNRIEGLLNG